MLTATADGRFCRVDGQVILSTRRRTRRAAPRRAASRRVASRRQNARARLSAPRNSRPRARYPACNRSFSPLPYFGALASGRPAIVSGRVPADRSRGDKTDFSPPLSSSIRRMKLPGNRRRCFSHVRSPGADVFTRRRTQNDSKCSRFEFVRLAWLFGRCFIIFVAKLFIIDNMSSASLKIISIVIADTIIIVAVTIIIVNNYMAHLRNFFLNNV